LTNPTGLVYISTVKLTIKTVNRAISSTGLELVRGKGYFYFVAASGDAVDVDSIPVFSINHLTLSRWIEEAEDAAFQHNKKNTQ